MKHLGLAAFTALLLVALASCGTPSPANRPAPQAQQAPPYFTGDAGRGIRLAVLVPDAVGLSAEQSYLPTMVQGVLVGDLARFSAISVLDRMTLESVLAETESGIYQSEEDFGRLGEIANVDYVLTGSITRTGAGHALQIQVVGTGRDNIGVTRASFSSTPTVAEMDDFTGIRRASMELLTQMGVSLTPIAMQALGGAVPQQSINAHTALAQGIIAQRGGTEIVALSRYMQAANHDPALAEAASRLNILEANVRSGNIGQDVRNDIAWRGQWVERLKEAEEFFAAHVQNFPPFYIVYSTDVVHVSTDFQNETAALRTGMVAAVADVQYFIVINRVMRAVRQGLVATGRAEVWGLDRWPSTTVGTALQESGIRNSSVEVELLNSDGRSLGRQRVNLRYGWQRDPLDQRRRPDGSSFLSLGAGGGVEINPVHDLSQRNITFQHVDANLITDVITIRISSIDGIPAERASREKSLSIMTVSDHSNIAGVRENGLDIDNLLLFGGGGDITVFRGFSSTSFLSSTLIFPYGLRWVAPPHRRGFYEARDPRLAVRKIIFPETLRGIRYGGHGSWVRYYFSNIESVTLPGGMSIHGDVVGFPFFAYRQNDRRAGTYTLSRWGFRVTFRP